jgi:hypothetical protein
MLPRAFVLAALVALSAEPLLAGEVTKSVPFVLDEWTELQAVDGAVTLHRVRLTRQSGLTKSKLFRPGQGRFLEDVQIQLEFSNDSTKDWEARLDVEWLDAAGEVVDGYDGEEGLDSEARREVQTVTLSTLKYGLARAKTLRFAISFRPD